jgi:tryptophan-rich sensory protein
VNIDSAAGLTGVAAPGGWYAGLSKPAWNPPAWLFGPAWTVLYALMAIAAWLVWRQGGWSANRWALGLFAAQLVLNLIWSPLFFGMHRMGWALIDSGLMAILIAATMVAFWRVSPAAGALMVPYLVWVCFATFLNFTIWNLNR